MDHMNSWGSYPKIYALGHRATAELLNVPVLIEEKVDGSQFSFGVTEDGEVKMRSKRVELENGMDLGMFHAAAQTVYEIANELTPGWTYRAEYLRTPKHNALHYNRIPDKHLVIFDINTGHEAYLDPVAKFREAERLGLEAVPLLRGVGNEDLTEKGMEKLLSYDSFLGGQKIEGFVVKPVGYRLFGEDKKVVMGKFVSEVYKETHAASWKKKNPTRSDVLEGLCQAYRSERRWEKAVERLRDDGKLDQDVTDIGLLMKEVPEDVKTECAEEIKDELFKWAWPQIRRKVAAGLPEWYKKRLLHDQIDA
jgi:hypothetical protein